jgi:hypothetical protein
MKILLVCLPRRRLFTNTMSQQRSRLSPAACAYTYKDPRPMREWQTSSKVKLPYWIFGQSRNVYIIVKRFVLRRCATVGRRRKICMSCHFADKCHLSCANQKVGKTWAWPNNIQKNWLIKFKPAQESSACAVVCFFFPIRFLK